MNKTPSNETDPRFPSGPWTGFFLDRRMPGRHKMELRLTFREGSLTGEGRDRVGSFLIRGRYATEDGRCHWSKTYVRRHSLLYGGYNEGKGIWGTWELLIEGILVRGGFHIWPEGQGDPSNPSANVAANLGADVPDDGIGSEDLADTFFTTV